MIPPWLEGVIGALKPKIDVSKGDAAWGIGGAVVGGVVDLALLPVGVVTLGTCSGMGAGAGFACKAGIDGVVKKWRGYKQNKKARAFAAKASKRATKAMEVFQKAGYTPGWTSLSKAVELHTAELKTDEDLNAATDAAIKGYEEWIAPQASKATQPRAAKKAAPRRTS